MEVQTILPQELEIVVEKIDEEKINQNKEIESNLPPLVTYSGGNEELAEIDELDNECSICFEQFSDSNPFTHTTCHHKFHFQCILQWQERSNCCPLCWTVFALEGEEIPTHVRLPSNTYHRPGSSSTTQVQDVDIRGLTQILELSSAAQHNPNRHNNRNNNNNDNRRSNNNGHNNQTIQTRPAAHSAPDTRTIFQGFSSRFSTSSVSSSSRPPHTRTANILTKLRFFIRRIAGRSNRSQRQNNNHSQQQQNNQSQFSPQPLIIFSDLSNSPHLHLHQTPPQTQEFEQTTHQETEQIQQIAQVEQTEEQPSLQQTFEIEEPLQSSIFIEQDQVNIIPTIIPISIPIVYES